MIFLWIFLGILIFLSLLSMLSAHIVLEYREDVTLTLSVLFFKYSLIPAKKKKTRISKKKGKQKKKQKPKEAPQNQQAPKKGILERLGFLRELLTTLLEKTLGHLKIRTARIRIRVATGDAASTAILFGAVNGGVALLLETLDQFGKLKVTRRDEIEVIPDYLATETTVDIRLLFSLRMWQILDILWKAFLAYIKIKKQKVRS